MPRLDPTRANTSLQATLKSGEGIYACHRRGLSKPQDEDGGVWESGLANEMGHGLALNLTSQRLQGW